MFEYLLDAVLVSNNRLELLFQLKLELFYKCTEVQKSVLWASQKRYMKSPVVEGRLAQVPAMTLFGNQTRPAYSAKTWLQTTQKLSNKKKKMRRGQQLK